MEEGEAGRGQVGISTLGSAEIRNAILGRETPIYPDTTRGYHSGCAGREQLPRPCTAVESNIVPQTVFGYISFESIDHQSSRDRL